MSFIYDDRNLLLNLLKFGQDPNAYAQQTTNFNNMNKLLDNLAQQVDKKVDLNTPNISHEGQAGTGVDLKLENMKNLSTMVNFLSTNQITINGQRIAYSGDEDPKDQNYDFVKLTPYGGLIESQDRSQMQQSYFINKALLQSYLVSLQQGLQQHPNKLVSITLSSLIKQSNDLLKTEINQEYQGHKVIKPVSGAETENQNSSKTNQQSGSNQQNGTNDPQLREHLISMLPFSTAYINLNDIEEFVNGYAQLSPGDYKVINLGQQIKTDINSVNTGGLMVSPGGLVQMNNPTVDDFKSESTQPLKLANVLWSIISNTGVLYQRFISEVSKEHPDQVNDMRQNIAGAQETNLADLRQLIKELQLDWQKGFKR